MSKTSYQLTEKLMEEGPCTSYKGTAFLPDGQERQVIVKILAPELAQDGVLLSHLAGFLDVVRGLNHPGVVPIWDFGNAGDYYFIIRDYIPGISLDYLFQLVKKGQAVLSPAIAVYLVMEIANAIAALHRYRVPGDQPIYLFHGGLSPHNIILTRVGGLTITDSGTDVIFWRNDEAAKSLRDGKGDYHSPEYNNGQRPMRRGDTYSVAALLYQMVVGLSIPEASQHYGDGRSIILPSSRNTRVTVKFDQVIMQALQPELSERTLQLQDFQESLQQLGVFRQAPVKRREATKYLEAVVKESEELSRPNTDDLLFRYPFQIESLLPSRSEIPTPSQRYRLPLHDRTEPYRPELHGGGEDSETTFTGEAPQETENEEVQSLTLEDLHEEEQKNAPLSKTNSALEEDFTSNLTAEDLLEQLEELDDSFIEELDDNLIEELDDSLIEELDDSLIEELDDSLLEELDELSQDDQFIEEAEEAEERTVAVSIDQVKGFSTETNPSSQEIESTQYGSHSPTSPELDSASELIDSPADERLLSTLNELDSEQKSMNLSASNEKANQQNPFAKPKAQVSRYYPEAEGSNELTSEQVSIAHNKDLLPKHLSTNPEISAISVELENLTTTPRVKAISESSIPSLGLAKEDIPQQVLLDTPETIGLHSPDTASQNAYSEHTENFSNIETEATNASQNHFIDVTKQASGGFSADLLPSTIEPAQEEDPETKSHSIESIKELEQLNQDLHRVERDPSKPAHPIMQPETVALQTNNVQGFSAQQATSPTSPLQHDELERFGKFVLLDRIALGGMAEVFRAKFEGPDSFQRLVAIKRILPEFSDDHHFIQMFKDEARIAGSLIHPNIVQIYELGEHDETYFISMEFVDGIDLARVIKIRRVLQQELPLEVVVSIGIAACKALNYAHEASDPNGTPLEMVHRDVTPHNILISKRGEIKLADFGIAKAAMNVSKTAVGELKGKLSYMSPEQARGIPLDIRSDLFQLGILLYECLTLRKMFEGQSDQSILSKIQASSYPPMSSIRSNAPPELERILIKSLAVDPADRYQSAKAFEQDLLRFRDSLRIPSERFEISPFATEVIQQRDELILQYNAAREQQKRATFSVWDNPPEHAEPAPNETYQQPIVPEQVNAQQMLTHNPNTMQQQALAVQNQFAQAPIHSQHHHQPQQPLVPVQPNPQAPASPDPFAQVSSHKWKPDEAKALPQKKSNPEQEKKKKRAILFLILGIFLLGTIIGGSYVLLSPPPPTPSLLTVTSSPQGAFVILDGKVIGKTPILEKELIFDKNNHVLTLRKAGYVSFQWPFKFQYQGEEVRLVTSLRRKRKRRFRRKRKKLKKRKLEKKKP